MAVSATTPAYTAPASGTSTPAGNLLGQAEQKFSMAQDFWVQNAAPRLSAFDTGVGNFMSALWTKLTPWYDQFTSWLGGVIHRL